jgi:hypothetical protein
MPYEDWTEVWPRKLGLYWFYGYLHNKAIDRFPRLHLVVVEYNSQHFGTVYRTGRVSIKKSTGAYGLWKKIDTPDIPDMKNYEQHADRASSKVRKVRGMEFTE